MGQEHRGNGQSGTVLLLSAVYAFYFVLLTADHLLSLEALLRFGVAWVVMDYLMRRAQRLWAGRRRSDRAREAAGASMAPMRRLFAWMGGLSARRYTLLLWAVLFLAYLPAYVGLYPGVFGYDSSKQMEFYTGMTAWSAHHPVFHTWLLGSLLSLGRTIWGSYRAGVGLYVFLQLLLISGAYAYALCHLRRIGAPAWLRVAGALYWICHPTIVLLTMNTTKDTLFGAVFLYFLVSYLELQDGQRGRLNYVLFLCSALLSCLLRNQGVYVMLALLALSLLAGALEHRRARAVGGGRVGRHPLGRIALGLAAVVVVTELFGVLCTSALHIERGDMREMLSVPMQQVAAVLRSESEGVPVMLTDEQRTLAYSLITPEAVAAYQPETADPVKGLFSSAVFSGNLALYLKNYLVIGLQNHGIYTDAWIEMIRPYWGMRSSKYRGLMALEPDAQTWELGQEDHGNAYGDLLRALAIQSDYLWIPVLSWLFDPGIYPWALTTILLLAISRRRWAALLGCLPGALYFATLLLGPVALARYVYPLLLTLPVVLGGLWASQGERGGGDTKTAK